MRSIGQRSGLTGWRRQRASAWGGVLDQQEILVAALSAQQTGAVRVQGFERLHVPEGLVHLSDGGGGWQRAWRGPLPKRLRTMALAITETHCRQGLLHWQGPQDHRILAAEVQLEAAAAWGVDPAALGFDFQCQAQASEGAGTVVWAACLREALDQWQQHVRGAGWRLAGVEPEQQAAQRAVVCLRGDMLQHWAQSPQDWQFDRTPQRAATDVDWLSLKGGALWMPLVACGAAMGAWF